MDGALDLFGKTALERGLVTRDQLDEGIREQARLTREGLPPRPLGEILVAKGYLSAEALASLLEAQRQRQVAAVPAGEAGPGRGEALGRLAVARGLCSETAVNEGLRMQQEMVEQGLRLSLGEVLVRRGHLRADQLQDLLALQQKTPFYCSTCHIVYNVVGYVPGKRCRCPECRHRLVLVDDPGRMVGSPGAFRSDEAGESRAGGPTEPAAGEAAVATEPGGAATAVAEAPAPAPAPSPTAAPAASPAAAPAPAAAPVSVGRYELLREIGRGTLGVVHKAWDTEARGITALKLLRDDLAARDDLRAFFLRSAEAHSTLAHRHILEPREVGEADGRAFFTMDYVEGRRFEDILAAEEAVAESVLSAEVAAPAAPMDPSPPTTATVPANAQDSGAMNRLGIHQALEIVRDTAAALGYAHARSIVHRGVRAANILVDAHFHGYLTDFGLDPEGEVDLPAPARAATPPAATPAPATPLPAARVRLSWAPEQVQRRFDRVGPATDVFALGGILYRILGGRAPFVGADDAALARAILHADPPPFRTASRFVQSDLKAVCLKCLEKDPAQRYANGTEVAEELTRFFEGRRTVVRPLTLMQRLRRRARRFRGVAAAAAVLALLFLLFVGYQAVASIRRASAVSHFLAAGKLREDGGDLKAARAAYSAALECDPADELAQARLAHLKLALEQRQAARRKAAAGEALEELGPVYTANFWAEVGRARVDLARAAKAAGRPWREDAQRAHDSLDRALSFDDRSVAALHARGLLLETEELYDQALNDYESADAILQGASPEIHEAVERLRAMYGGGFQK